MGWIILIVCVFIALGMYSCCVVAKQAEEAAEEMRLKRLLLDSERLTEAAIASDVGRRRGFEEGYEACRDELAEKMKEVADRPKGEWEEKETFSVADDDPIIERWQSARCSMCESYHTTPYMYYFSDYNFCPYCGADMRGEDNDI